MPKNAQAGFFSILFGSPAEADSGQSDLNSQSLNLLQANVSPASIIQDKNSKKNEEINNDERVNILSDNALLASTGPMGAYNGTGGDASSDQISVYVVRKGDSISQIAQMFGVSVNTIRWANDIKAGQAIKEGDILIILPVSGVQVTVAKGMTLKGLAKKYGVDVFDIASFNGIAQDTQLSVGDELIIPDGIIVDDGGNKPKSINSGKSYYQTRYLADVAGYFMNPVPGAKLSQGFHGSNSVDLAITRGTPILAAAPGTVIFARMGWNGAYGGLVIINHSNGTQTLYAHQSKIVTRAGNQVSQGEVVGYVGSTGRSTGSHVHLEIHGAKNPAAFLPTGVHLDANWKY
jgi:murein DD-endopeptidase MepM/ murein hydrolase activator NlpD